MSMHVFVGPSCARQEVLAILPDAQLHGPASQGDVYRVTMFRPSAIAIVDGYFEHRLAVWHKELLWALHCGVRVYGASSMGALRAVEMAPYGMIGVGRVYALFADGTLEADDEVALCHLGPEHEHRAQTEALVNIRVTLAAAAAECVISRAAHVQLTLAAQGLFYPDRSYPRVIEEARAAGMPDAEASAFQAWLGSPPQGIDQKHLDALELFERMRAERDTPAPSPPERSFPYTEAWHVFTRQIEASAARGLTPC